MRSLLVAVLCLLLATPALAADSEEAAEQAAALKFVKTLQDLAAKGQSKDIAKLVDYPLYLDGKPKIKNADAFVKNYDSIFTPLVKECLDQHKMDEEFSSVKGDYPVGWGCIWITPGEKGKMSFGAVNTKKD